MTHTPLTPDELNWFAVGLEVDAPNSAWIDRDEYWITNQFRRLVATIDSMSPPAEVTRDEVADYVCQRGANVKNTTSYKIADALLSQFTIHRKGNTP